MPIGVYKRKAGWVSPTSFKKGQVPWNAGTAKPKIIKVRKDSSTSFKKGHTPWSKGKTLSVELREKLSLAHIGMPNKSKGNKRPHVSGERHPNWIKDRTLVKVDDRVINDPLRKEWTRAVKNRDNWKCKISNGDCSGRLEAHHILGWSSHPELRYLINNGIALCHFHHPKKREDEKRLSPYFMELVSVSKE